MINNLSVPGGFVSFHGPVVTQLGSLPKISSWWLKNLLTKTQSAGTVPLGKMKTVVRGKARGVLMGGNLAILASLAGTPYLPNLAGSILLLEDTMEHAYRLDRFFTQLVQSGALKKVKGIVLGSLAGCKLAGNGTASARQVLETAASSLKVPVVSGASFGHIDKNTCLPLGVNALLDASKKSLSILEPAVI